MIFFFLVTGWVMGYLGRVDPQKNQIESRVNSFLFRVRKPRFGLGIFRVGLGQQILTCFAMSLWLDGLKEAPIAVGVATCFVVFILTFDPESP